MQFFRLFRILKTFIVYQIDDLIPPHLLPWYFSIFKTIARLVPGRRHQGSRGERLRLALESLGPVWIKLGQMLSTRRDLLPPDIANELAKLQDNVKPFDGHEAKHIIEQALGLKDISERFDDFAIKPLASASIAQVHTAILRQETTDRYGNKAESKEDIIIKVIRPGIDKSIRDDTRLMETTAWLLLKLVPDARRLRPVEVIEEYRKTIFDELDLMHEAANAIQLRQNFEESDSLYVPWVYSDYCATNVMVMERIYGIPVSDIKALEAQNTNMKLLAERGVQVFFTQVFRDSFFHADMHPGNIFVSYETPENPKYIGIDCGIVGTLNEDDKRYLAENFVAFFNRDYRKVAQLHVDSGWVPADTNVQEFEIAIRNVCDPIFAKPLSEISFGHVLINLFNTARRFNMEVQPQLVLLQKTLLYIEGLGRQLYPQLDLWTTAKPFLETWLNEQMGPKAVFKHIKQNLPFWGEKLPEIPELVYQYLKNDQQQHIQQRKFQQSLLQQQQQQNRRIIYTMIGATFTVVSTLLFLHQETSWLPVTGMLAFLALVAGLKKKD